MSYIDALRKGFFIFMLRFVQHAPLYLLMLVVYSILAPIFTAMAKIRQRYDILVS